MRNALGRHGLPVGEIAVTACVEGIILAAGLSTRMGRPKLLIQLHGEPMLARVVKTALKSRLERVILVLAEPVKAYQDALGQMAVNQKLHTVINSNPEKGMASSLRVGLSAVRAGTAGAMVILADQPWLQVHVIDSLMQTFLDSASPIAVPTVRGRRTTPVIFPSDLFPELMNETGDVGGRNVLKRHCDKIVYSELGSGYDDSDFDTPEDLKRTSPMLSLEEDMGEIL